MECVAAVYGNIAQTAGVFNLKAKKPKALSAKF